MRLLPFNILLMTIPFALSWLTSIVFSISAGSVGSQILFLVPAVYSGFFVAGSVIFGSLGLAINLLWLAFSKKRRVAWIQTTGTAVFLCFQIIYNSTLLILALDLGGYFDAQVVLDRLVGVMPP